MNFGTFHFRQADRTLWRDSQRVPMTAKARDLLACLVSANGRFVSKAEIMTAVWPDIHVLPDNVKVLVHEIRSVLEEDARNPHFIRSEAGLGYAFVPEGLTPDPPAAGDRTHGLFLNRNRELAVLAEAFEDVRAGSSRVVILNGERGIGKTALCDVFLRLPGGRAPARARVGGKARAGRVVRRARGRRRPGAQVPREMPRHRRRAAGAPAAGRSC